MLQAAGLPADDFQYWVPGFWLHHVCDWAFLQALAVLATALFWRVSFSCGCRIQGISLPQYRLLYTEPFLCVSSRFQRYEAIPPYLF